MPNFSGYWRSRYIYNSSSRPGNLEGKHVVRALQTGNKLVFESASKLNPSYLVLRLAIDEQDNVATGSWQEVTSAAGHYKGAAYHGAIQLIINEDGKAMKGKWLGFSKDRQINTGPWEFTYLSETLPES